MPSFNFVKQVPVSESFRVKSIKSMYDIADDHSHVVERFIGSIDIENKSWNVGVIVGNSGTGKSSIIDQVFGGTSETEYGTESILDSFPKRMSVKEISKLLSVVGFASPMSWLKPYHILSNGEKMRVDLARAIADDREIIIFDEYTSVVNRDVAKIGSLAVQKAVRKTNKKFIAVSCHFDILEWLEPDWVFNTNTMSFFLKGKVNTKDQLLSLRSIEQQEARGGSLVVITI